MPLRESTSGYDQAVPESHSEFLRAALEKLPADSRLIGLAAGGSFVTRTMDEFSDLDLVVAVNPADYDDVLDEREDIAATLGPLLAAFTGEHVGEPRLLICLYGPPPIHVDLKFASLPDLAERVEDPVVLWERDGRLSEVLLQRKASYPRPDPQWIEDRFWIWVHYCATKIGRGELFEAIEFLSFLRTQVLGPLALERAGARPTGVRRLELEAPDFAGRLKSTLATHDRRSCAEALRVAAGLYLELRPGDLKLNPAAQRAAMDYLARVG